MFCFCCWCTQNTIRISINVPLCVDSTPSGQVVLAIITLIFYCTSLPMTNEQTLIVPVYCPNIINIFKRTHIAHCVWRNINVSNSFYDKLILSLIKRRQRMLIEMRDY